VFEIEHRLRRHDGVYRWHLGRAVPMHDEYGRFQKWLGTNIDIESQKKAEQSLKDLAETLERRVAERTEQLRMAANEIALVEQRERRRLSQTLHDHLQQLLVTARLKVSMALGRLETPERARALLQELDRLLDDTIEASRDLALDLSPPVLHERRPGRRPALARQPLLTAARDRRRSRRRDARRQSVATGAAARLPVPRCAGAAAERGEARGLQACRTDAFGPDYW
jgi:signal transduction histidine kinase